jgi:hypothetical protein
MAKLFAKAQKPSKNGRYFLTSAMMAEVKRDDAMRNAVEKRRGNKPPVITHIPCGCGCGVIGAYVSERK